MNIDFILPWHQPAWQHLVQRWQKGQLAHALLLSGAAGLGKLHLARNFARWLLCSQNHNPAAVRDDSEPCGRCQGCLLMKAGSHPDFLEVLPETDGKQIPIDSIRDVSSYLSLKSQFAPLQVVVIAPAEAMNKYAANSLLKTLEEPTPGTLLILVTSQLSRLLPTIRSRCQTMEFAPPERSVALRWLAAHLKNIAGVSEADMARLLVLTGDAPLAALEYAQQNALKSYDQLLASLEKLARNQADPVTEAKLWESVGLSESVKWMYLWITAMIRLKSGMGEVDNQSEWREPVLERLAPGLDNRSLFQYLDQLTGSARLVNSQVNIQLTLEDLLINWQKLHRRTIKSD
ncbi:MAG: DNA polymerase III subunit delta' [Gammaproteobacteria bacterium]|nr:DNA polymerase III subunit delta' [Gammaproteobacteria bacterium]